MRVHMRSLVEHGGSRRRRTRATSPLTLDRNVELFLSELEPGSRQGPRQHRRSGAVDRASLWVAVAFELALNLATDADRQEAERALVGQLQPSRRRPASCWPDRHGLYGRYIEFAVVVPAIGAGGPTCSVPFDVRTLSGAEISEVGTQLFDLLREVPSFQAAAVGWDPEGRVDPSELKADLADGWPVPPGVVLVEELADQLGVKDAMRAFDSTHVWVPYEGDPSLWESGP